MQCVFVLQLRVILLRALFQQPYLPFLLQEKTRSQVYEDEYEWLNREQIRVDVCQGNLIHAEEIIKVASSKNLSSAALID